MANHNSMFPFCWPTNTHLYLNACKPNLPEELDKNEEHCILNWILLPLLFSVGSCSGGCVCTVCVCKSDKGAARENTRKWPNASTVGGLKLVPHEWGLWLRSEESRSVAVPMLPYQCCREKKEGRKEWLLIGAGTDTLNKPKNRQRVRSGMVERFPLVFVNIYILMNTLTPQAKCYSDVLCVGHPSVAHALCALCLYSKCMCVVVN